MTNIIGRLEDVGIGVESTRGTAVAPSYWLATSDKTFEDRASVILDDSAYGVLGEHSQATLAKQWADGSLAGNVGQNSIGVLLVGLAGNVPTPSVSSGEYTHTFVQTNSVTNKSLTVAFKDANQDLRFANAMLDSLKLSWETDKFFNFEAQFMSKKSASASNTVSRAAENRFAAKDSVIKIASTQGGLDGASALAVRSASITFAKNVEDKQNLGSVDVADVLNKSMVITGTLEIYYDGTTYKDYVFNETERAVRLSVVNTDVTLANGSNPTIEIDLYRVRFSDWDRQRGSNDVVTETVNFTALTDFSNSQKQYTIDVLNGVSSY